MSTARNIKCIPATRNLHTGGPQLTSKKRRAAGYARVSTDSDEQFTSYEAQVDYYTRYIQGRSDWEFVKVYTDEGISALNTKNREGFNSMIADAMAGKIDIIITKSVSRFARNTVDSLVTIRQLKDHGVEVYFEKENIYTFDSKGELLLTIMSSLAQEESRSISENVTWGKRKQFADGKVWLPYKRFLGYERGPDGMPKIVPEQAKIVVYIYDLFMMGLTAAGIAKRLTDEGIPTPGGKEVWGKTTVTSILTNEKYKGDALLQKMFTTDFLQKKRKINEGEVPQYYVENSHPAIISRELFDRVQAEMQRRKGLDMVYRYTSVFSARIVCGDCGSFYGPKIWDSTNQFRRKVYQCNQKYEGDHVCRTPHVTEEEIKDSFLEAFNKLILEKDALLEDCETMRAFLMDTTAIDQKIEQLQTQSDELAEQARQCILDSVNTGKGTRDWEQRYQSLMTRYNETEAELAQLAEQKSQRTMRASIVSAYAKTIEMNDGGLTVFDPRLWMDVVDQAIVYKDKRIVFRFVDGTEVET